MKAATILDDGLTLTADISIHAAREGGDIVRHRLASYSQISIHAAREGGDEDGNGLSPKSRISIHAAREGGDQNRAAVLQNKQNFNPRRP